MKTISGKLPIRNLTENLVLMAFMMLMFLFLTIQKATAQTDHKRMKNINVWLVLQDGSKLNGKVAQIKVDSIWLLVRGQREVFLPEKIESIAVRGSGRLSEGVLYGSAIGALTGGLMSLAVTSQGSDQAYLSNSGDKPAVTVAFVLSGFVVGGTIGGVIGHASRTKYEINGSSGKFRLFLTEAGLNELTSR